MLIEQLGPRYWRCVIQHCTGRRFVGASNTEEAAIEQAVRVMEANCKHFLDPTFGLHNVGLPPIPVDTGELR